MIGAGLFTLLSTTSTVTAICGTRIYPDVRPTAPQYPLIEIKEIGGRGRQTMSTPGMQRHRYQFECYAQMTGDAYALRNAVEKLLDGFNGILSDGTYLQNGEVIRLDSSYSDEPRIYCRTIEFHLYFNYSS